MGTNLTVCLIIVIALMARMFSNMTVEVQLYRTLLIHAASVRICILKKKTVAGVNWGRTSVTAVVLSTTAMVFVVV